MPQGPVGRGCEACRAQKKKCDLMQPACSRCRRLRIACRGCGERRFKFTTVRTAEPSTQDEEKAFYTLASMPSNETTHLVKNLVARLHESNDVRYDMTIRWGSYLFEIPRMLGASKALDAATAALLARHTETSLRQDQSDMGAPAIMKYNRALAVLRTTLDEPAKASSIETLSAVLLLTFCQARTDDQFTFFWSPHAQGLAQLIRMRGFPSGRDVSERQLFAVMHTSLIIQSIANPDIRLSSLEYGKVAKAFYNATPMNPVVRHQLLITQLSEVMQRGRDAIACGTSLDAIAKEAMGLESSFDNLIAHVKNRLEALESEFGEQFSNPRLHALCLGVYGVMLATKAILLCAKGTLSPNRPDWHVTSANLCREVLRVVGETKAYRPHGAVWTVHTLICMWCASKDESLRARVEDALLDYQRDAMGPRAELQMDKLRLLERRLWLFE